MTFGAIVNHSRGVLFDPTRRTPIHPWAEAHGAMFEDVGQWKRAWYFPRPGETMHAAVNRECVTVRKSAGLFDATTLGKIEVVGPDAAKFMELLYTNPWGWSRAAAAAASCCARTVSSMMTAWSAGCGGPLPRHHHTGGAPRVMSHMEDYLQTEFPHLNVWLTSISEQWAVIAVQDRSRAPSSSRWSRASTCRTRRCRTCRCAGRICGVPTRLFRMSFTGDRGSRSTFRPTMAGRLEALWAEGRSTTPAPISTGRYILRAEGLHHRRRDTDGTVTPGDAGLDWAVGKKKTDFVGIRGLTRPDIVAPAASNWSG